MTYGFQRTATGRVVLRVDDVERGLLMSVARQVMDLVQPAEASPDQDPLAAQLGWVDGDVGISDDPAVARLLPDAYYDPDPDDRNNHADGIHIHTVIHLGGYDNPRWPGGGGNIVIRGNLFIGSDDVGNLPYTAIPGNIQDFINGGGILGEPVANGAEHNAGTTEHETSSSAVNREKASWLTAFRSASSGRSLSASM